MSIKFINKGGGKIVLPYGTHLAFGGSSFSSIDFINNIDTSECVTMQSCFTSCTNLTNIDLRNLKTGEVKSMSSMFYKCTNLISIDLRGFDTSKVTNMSGMFQECTNLTTIIGIENLDMSNLPYNSYDLFKLCPSLSQETLNNILKALSTITYITSRRTLLRQGFTEEQATICTTLPNWAELETLGWTTGY